MSYKILYVARGYQVGYQSTRKMIEECLRDAGYFEIVINNKFKIEIN